MKRTMEWIFPVYPLRRREDEAGQVQLWDPVRQKWVAEQPEELVRQQLLLHLTQTHGVPRGRIGVEKEIAYYAQRKRFDVVVFDAQAQPSVLIEVKAPEVDLTEQTLMQVARYNQTIQAPHLLLTNGRQLLFFSRGEDGRYQFVPEGWYE